MIHHTCFSKIMIFTSETAHTVVFLSNFNVFVYLLYLRQRKKMEIVLLGNERKDSLEASLNRELFAAELEFTKMLVPRLLQNSSNVNIECAGKSKQLYSIFFIILGALIYLHFIILILICF